MGLYQKKKAKHCGPTERARRVAPLGTDLFSQSLWLSSHSGGCLIGFFELFLAHSKIPLEAALFVITGFLGARTTFSTFGALPQAVVVTREAAWACVGTRRTRD